MTMQRDGVSGASEDRQSAAPSALTGRQLKPASPAMAAIATADAASLNATLEAAFDDGADSVLLCRLGISCEGDAAATLARAAAQAGADAVVSAIVVQTLTPETSHRARRFVGDHHWSPDLLAWHRETGYLHLADGLTMTVRASGYASSDVLLVPRAAWAKVGRFDERFGSCLADVDWMIRADRLAIPRYTLLSAAFTASESQLFPSPKPTGDELAGALLLARKHGAPCSWTGLLWRRIRRALSLEQPSTGFWADYGIKVDVLRRLAWYANTRIPRRRWAAFRCEISAARRSLNPSGSKRGHG